jgi:hypothetical protein
MARLGPAAVNASWAEQYAEGGGAKDPRIHPRRPASVSVANAVADDESVFSSR